MQDADNFNVAIVDAKEDRVRSDERGAETRYQVVSGSPSERVPADCLAGPLNSP
jgi:hypothetical protein